jgi:peptidyl-prolyl cis-trans isomerase B (cyclophilin B)
MRTHDYGAVGMARASAYDSASSQFYVVRDRAGRHELDYEYVVFGRVIKGMDVVEAIRRGQKIRTVRVVHERDHGYEVKHKIVE